MRGVCFFLALASAYGAEPALSLNGLVEEALQNNREILVAQKRYEAATQRPRQAGALPDPVFSAGYSAGGNPLPGAGLGTNPASNIGFSVTQAIPYPGKRRLRENAASKEAEAEFAQYQLTKRNVIARLKQAFFQLQHSYAAGEVLERNRELLRELLKVTEARYAVGKAAEPDIFKLQTQLSIVETRRLQLEQERQVAQAEMLRLLDRQAGAILERPGEPHLEAMPAALDDLYAHALASPILLRDQKIVEHSELAVNLARKDFYPDYAVTGGYYNQGSMAPLYSVRLDIGLPVFPSRKQRPALTERVDDLWAARHNYEASEQSIRAQIKQDYAIARTSLDLMKLYRDTAIPQAKLAIESALPSYESGDLDFLSVLTNYTTVIDLEMDYHVGMLNYHLALARLEEATGLALIH